MCCIRFKSLEEEQTVDDGYCAENVNDVIKLNTIIVRTKVKTVVVVLRSQRWQW